MIQKKVATKYRSVEIDIALYTVASFVFCIPLEEGPDSLAFPLSSVSTLSVPVALRVRTCAKKASVVQPQANLMKTLFSKLRRSAKMVAGSLADSIMSSKRGVEDVNVDEEAAFGANVPVNDEPELDNMTL